MTWALVVAGWLVLGSALGPVIGRGIRLADQMERHR